jgi:hypothetical protein
MKILIEDYQRRLVTITEMIETTSNSGSNNDIAKMARLNAKTSEYRTFIAEMERELREGVSIYDLWVVQMWVGDKSERIFFTKEDAESQARFLSEDLLQRTRKDHPDMSEAEFKDYFQTNFRAFGFKVMTLDDAMREYAEMKDLPY